MASIIVGYPINVGSRMFTKLSLMAQQENTSYPYLSTIIEYLVDAKVETSPYDIKENQ